MIRTAWIGGSYEAATRQTITDLPPTAISRRHAALFKMRVKQLIHSVKISVTYGNGNQRRPACLWYPGPAPATVNHMTVGRQRGKA